MKLQLQIRQTIPRKHRNAVVTVMVLVVLLLMSGLVAQFVRRAVVDRRQMRQELHHQQAMHLAEAGMMRLQQKRIADPDYTGETWEIPAGTIHQTNPGLVIISIEDNAATIVARYPVNQKHPIQVTRRMKLSQ